MVHTHLSPAGDLLVASYADNAAFAFPVAPDGAGQQVAASPLPTQARLPILNDRPPAFRTRLPLTCKAATFSSVT